MAREEETWRDFPESLLRLESYSFPTKIYLNCFSQQLRRFAVHFKMEDILKMLNLVAAAAATSVLQHYDVCQGVKRSCNGNLVKSKTQLVQLVSQKWKFFQYLGSRKLKEC